MSDFRLLMLSAMYENGGNVTHRSLDGHPDMFVYPFESQLGTSLVNDPLASMFPLKYRWPVFSLSPRPRRISRRSSTRSAGSASVRPTSASSGTRQFDVSDTERADRYAELVRRLRSIGRQ